MSGGKLLVYNAELREKILSGVTKLSQTVGITMGPEGKNVILQQHIGAPTITKDGVSVARQVVLEDPIEELGCQLIKEVAGRTAAIAGDGTTTATVLSHEILYHGIQLINKGYSTVNLKLGLDWAEKEILKYLKTISHPVSGYNDIRNIAIISANNDVKLGTLIADAFDKAKGGMITAQAKPGVESYIEQIDGLEIKSGFLTSAFLDENQAKVNFNNCRVLICNREITHISDNPKLFNDISAANVPLVIICKDLKKEALQLMLQNNRDGRIKVCAIKLPADGFGKMNLFQDRWLEDLAIQLGTVIVNEENGISLSEIKMEDLGKAENIIIDRYSTKIIGPVSNEKLKQERLREYEEDRFKLLKDREKIDLDDRIASLKGKSTIMVIGYQTEVELKEVGDRIDDAIFAVECAINSGYVIGSGIALLRAGKYVSEKIHEIDEALRPAAAVLITACIRPSAQIFKNAELEHDKIISKILEDSDLRRGYNIKTGSYEDIVSLGIIDPLKVTETALKNSVSISSLLLRTNAAVVENPENPAGWQPPAGFRLPGNNYNHKW